MVYRHHTMHVVNKSDFSFSSHHTVKPKCSLKDVGEEVCSLSFISGNDCLVLSCLVPPPPPSLHL